MKKNFGKRLKTAEEIADAIFEHGNDAFLASRFPTILEDEVRAGGHTEDLTKVKTAVALICNIRRRSHRSVA